MTYLRCVSHISSYVVWRGHVTAWRRCPTSQQIVPHLVLKLFSLGTIESSDVASTAIVEFLIDTLCYQTMMALVVLAHTLKNWITQNSSSWCRECDWTIVMVDCDLFIANYQCWSLPQLLSHCHYVAAVSQRSCYQPFSALLLLHDVQLRRNWWFHLQQFQWYGNQIIKKKYCFVWRSKVSHVGRIHVL